MPNPMDEHKQSDAYLSKLPLSDFHEKCGGEDEYVEPKEPRIRINFWVDESLYYAIKGKLLDHKRATRERKTITDICTKALQDYIQNGETAQAVLEQAVKDYLAEPKN